MKRVSLEELLKKAPSLQSYQQQYDYILSRIQKGEIKPVKASGKNGKRPALYQRYWLIEKSKDYSQLEEELKYSLSPEISIDYYMKNLSVYEKERDYVLMLNRYLMMSSKDVSMQRNSKVSVNERSFEIWHREKFLSREEGRRILKHCGIGMGRLCTYETSEPISYYSHTRMRSQNILIIENKDTYYSIRRHLLSNKDGKILGVKIGTLIYGGGKRILRSCRDFALSVEPYMIDNENQYLYFGDLDFEGIRIYEDLKSGLYGSLEEPRKYSDGHNENNEIRIVLAPFLQGYEAMLRKAEVIGFHRLPETKEAQNHNIKDIFLSAFDDTDARKIQEILTMGKYIPQEILNIQDL